MASHLNTPWSVLRAPKPHPVTFAPGHDPGPSKRRVRVLERRAARKRAQR